MVASHEKSESMAEVDAMNFNVFSRLNSLNFSLLYGNQQYHFRFVPGVHCLKGLGGTDEFSLHIVFHVKNFFKNIKNNKRNSGRGTEDGKSLVSPVPLIYKKR